MAAQCNDNTVIHFSGPKVSKTACGRVLGSRLVYQFWDASLKDSPGEKLFMGFFMYDSLRLKLFEKVRHYNVEIVRNRNRF